MDWVQWWAVGLAAFMLLANLFDDVRRGDPWRLVGTLLAVTVYVPVLGRVWKWW